MVANIAEIEGMAYLGDSPWHRLGAKMEGTPSIEDALAAAQLNWDVELQPMFLKRDGKVGRRIPRRQAVVRSSDGAVLATVGGKYEPVQNSEAVGVLRTAAEQHGVVIETLGALGIGDRCWALARLPHSFEPVTGDKINGYMLLHWGHNGWTPFTGRPTSVRVVCQNTLSMAMKDSEIVRLKHTKTEVEQIAAVGELINNLVATLKLHNMTFTELAAKKLTPATIDAYIGAVLGIPSGAEIVGRAKTRFDTMRELVDKGRGVQYAPGTAWAAFNAVTEYIDHTRTAKNARVLRNADQSALFGPTARLKQKALALALSA